MYTETKGNTAQGRYESCETQRELFLERARDSAKLTLPTLIPDNDYTNTTKYKTQIYN